MMENGFPLLKIRSADVFWLATILLFMIDSPVSMLELMELLGLNRILNFLEVVVGRPQRPKNFES